MIALWIVGILLAIFLALASRQSPPNQPPRLKEAIPFVTNAWQFMTNKKHFITRIKNALRTSPLVQCQLGPLTIYFVTGSDHVPTLFKSNMFTSDPWVIRILERTAGYFPVDLTKFSRDDSGSSRLPRTGSTEGLLDSERIWHAMHQNYNATLVGPDSVNTIAASYQPFFHQELTTLLASKEGGTDLLLFDFLKKTMSRAATLALFGPGIIDINPGFMDAFWKYENFAEPLAFGLPNWLNKEGVEARNTMRAMCTKWYEHANREFPWESVEEDHDTSWEPIFGSPLSRRLARWGKSFDFDAVGMGPVYTLFIFALHSNTIPICTWIMIELIKDPKLFSAVRRDITKAALSNETSSQTFDIHELTSLPLLQSIYAEALRLHVGILITRTSVVPVTIAGHNFPPGTVFQSPTQLSHLEESVWGVPGHPASEFWAHRHLKEKKKENEKGEIEKHLEFSLAGPPGAFFPYGGGTAMCAGRNLAKAEVLVTVAMLVSRLDLKFLEWLKPDGSPSDRPALDNTKYANAVAAPPDREMRVQWGKRVDGF
ncbi:25-hydroxycholesterol 7-alpha-hydroxylase [Apiospora arundinis]|uniref:25-hydroxycholesterol 7-alpha-hydroxylase n=1 Tax=Apiospora arundinis TaxID=335852 RepID=A0ABR2IAE7_9PEZI